MIGNLKTHILWYFLVLLAQFSDTYEYNAKMYRLVMTYFRMQFNKHYIYVGGISVAMYTHKLTIISIVQKLTVLLHAAV